MPSLFVKGAAALLSAAAIVGDAHADQPIVNAAYAGHQKPNFGEIQQVDGVVTGQYTGPVQSQAGQWTPTAPSRQLAAPGLMPTQTVPRLAATPVSVRSSTRVAQCPAEGGETYNSDGMIYEGDGSGGGGTPAPAPAGAGDPGSAARYPRTNAPLYPSPVQYTPSWQGGTIITNQALAPHEMLYPHQYKAMYGPFYYKVKGGWILTPFGMKQHEDWKLEGTVVKVKYRSHYGIFSGFHPPCSVY